MIRKRTLFVGLLLGLLLTACGGGGSGDNPTDIVEKVANAMTKLDLEEAADYYCEEMKGTLEADLESGFAELEDLGLNPDELLEAFQIKLDDMKYEEKSKDGDKAVVHATGTMSLDLDTDKLKEFFRKAAEAAGEQVTDEELNMVTALFGAVSGQEAPVDGDVELIKEDGKWVVCGDVSFLEGTDLFELPLP